MPVNEAFRAVYVVFDQGQGELSRRIHHLWWNALPPDDPLGVFREPADLLGEAKAWGEWPHVTVLDALTTDRPEAFDAAVEATVARFSRPTLTPGRPRKLLGGNAYAIPWESPRLQVCRKRLIAATHNLIARVRISDEAWQRARFWTERVGGPRVAANLKALHTARERYVNANAPPLPSSRHFGLGYLVRLSKALDKVRKAAMRERAERHLKYFLTRAEPAWYASTVPLHLTIASGVGASQTVASLNAQIWGSIQPCLSPCQPAFLAIMGEDRSQTHQVKFKDHLTGEFLPEDRYGLKVLKRVPFKV